MRFALTEEQRAFAESLDDLLTAAEAPAAARAWGAGDTGPGLRLWGRLARLGLHALRLPEEYGGLGAGPVETVVAFERLGRHPAPGPYVESAVVAPVLLGVAGAPRFASPDALAEGREIVTFAAPPWTPLALDAEAASRVLVLDGHTLREAEVGAGRRSVDASRRLHEVAARGELGGVTARTAAAALDEAALACAAVLLGAGRRLLAEAVSYAGVRRQFGRAIGEYQALKHALADVRVGLDFAEPLLYRAALSLGEEAPEAARDVSAAKVAAAGAAHRAARTALQVHGAVGYTLEHDLGMWVTKVRALMGAWGTPAVHRSRVLAAVAPDAAVGRRD
ncbi:acyl-CoA dehydrogenase family protein [Streptomyces xiaopingdaonensis]|uniref:acyl-CoA dehydrogenase family protein n=1 Tax=Streptomyces xiaopingdaonensis TaxID=1565415 RepID=UPI00030032CD|nr:acyl-CoA dehydrogenase family protein [Streptomyces xiaopingdaonensis]